jgi:hypothetical protein
MMYFEVSWLELMSCHSNGLDVFVFLFARLSDEFGLAFLDLSFPFFRFLSFLMSRCFPVNCVIPRPFLSISSFWRNSGLRHMLYLRLVVCILVWF